MNVLTGIRVKGEVYFEYAFLEYEYTFAAEKGTAVSAEYRFTLPEGAVISNVKIADENGRTTVMSVIPLSHAAALWNSAETAILRKIDSVTYSLNLGSVTDGGCRAVLSVYAPISDKLTLPLCGGCAASVELYMHAVKDVSSVTHRINKVYDNNGMTVTTGKISADRDFCIQMENREKTSSAVVAENASGGEMLCRLYTESSGEKKYGKILLIYDKCSLSGGALAAAKEFVCAAAEEFNGEFAAAEYNGEYGLVTDGFCRYSEEAVKGLVYSLSVGEVYGELDLSKCGDDVLRIVVCGEASEIPMEDKYVVTLGANARGIRSGAGHEHIYGGDDIRLRTKEILKSFMLAEKKISVSATEAVVIKEDRDGCVVYARYSGRVPKSFEIYHGDTKRIVELEKIEIYRSFAPLGLVCAEQLVKVYSQRLKTCDVNEIQQIRAKIEEVGVRYSALNSETALAAVTDGGKPSPVRVVVPDRSADVFEGRATMFMEEDFVFSKTEKAALLNMCREVVFSNIRACGGIFAYGEINPFTQRYYTLLCGLVLIAAGECGAYIDAAGSFVGDFSHKGMHFTQNMSEAYEMTEKIFGDEPAVFAGMPDLFTSAKFIWQMMRQNNDVFC